MLDAATAPAVAHLDPAQLSKELTTAYAEEPVTFTSILALPRRVVAHIADLHAEHFTALGTRPGRRGLSAWGQSVAFCRVMLDDVEPGQIARDGGIARSTAHLRLAESEKIVAVQAPSLKEALAAAG